MTAIIMGLLLLGVIGCVVLVARFNCIHQMLEARERARGFSDWD